MISERGVRVTEASLASYLKEARQSSSAKEGRCTDTSNAESQSAGIVESERDEKQSGRDRGERIIVADVALHARDNAGGSEHRPAP